MRRDQRVNKQQNLKFQWNYSGKINFFYLLQNLLLEDFVDMLQATAETKEIEDIQENPKSQKAFLIGLLQAFKNGAIRLIKHFEQ